jgi:hypothetical protein
MLELPVVRGVHVSRVANGALIAHDAAPSLVVRIELGPHATSVSEREVYERCHQTILALGAAMIGSPQVVCDELTGRWRPLGRALHCSVERGPDGLSVWVDDDELSLCELGALLEAHGARVILMFLDD